MRWATGLVYVVFQLAYLLIIARVVLSWMRLPRYGLMAERFAPFVYNLTEPMLRPVRRVLRPYQGGQFDFSPMAVVLFLMIAEAIILRVLH